MRLTKSTSNILLATSPMLLLLLLLVAVAAATRIDSSSSSEEEEEEGEEGETMDLLDFVSDSYAGSDCLLLLLLPAGLPRSPVEFLSSGLGRGHVVAGLGRGGLGRDLGGMGSRSTCLAVVLMGGNNSEAARNVTATLAGGRTTFSGRTTLFLPLGEEDLLGRPGHEVTTVQASKTDTPGLPSGMMHLMKTYYGRYDIS